MKMQHRLFQLLALAALVALAALGCDDTQNDSASEESAEASAPSEEGEASEQAEDEGESAEANADDSAESHDEEQAEEAQEAPEPGASGKEADIRKLLDVTGSARIGVESADQLIEQFKTAMPQVPEEFWRDFRAELNEEALVELLVPIYDKHLTHEEITGLIEFFETPIGKSYVEKMPAIMRESQMAGQKWGQKVGMKVQKKLQSKGYR